MRALPTAGLLLLTACPSGGSKTDTGASARPAPTGDPGPEGHAYTTYTGRTRFQWAYDADPDARTCDLVWSSSGGPSESLCPECIWAFDLALTYDEDASISGEGCLEEGDDPNLEWTLGLSLTYAGEEVRLIWYEVPDTGWYPLFYADWDYPNLVFDGGYYEYGYPPRDAEMYYTSYWSAEAVVQ